VDHRFDTPRELAEVIDAQRRLGLGNGLVIANPIPKPTPFLKRRWKTS
jgi:pseudouridine-5'-phosphate glycosidase